MTGVSRAASTRAPVPHGLVQPCFELATDGTPVVMGLDQRAALAAQAIAQRRVIEQAKGR